MCFCLYIDDLLKRLEEVRVRYWIGNVITGAKAYAA